MSLLVSDSHRVDGQPERLHPRLKIDSASKGNNDSVLVSRTRTDANRSEQWRRETSLTVTFECNKWRKLVCTIRVVNWQPWLRLVTAGVEYRQKEPREIITDKCSLCGMSAACFWQPVVRNFLPELLFLSLFKVDKCMRVSLICPAMWDAHSESLSGGVVEVKTMQGLHLCSTLGRMERKKRRKSYPCSTIQSSRAAYSPTQIVRAFFFYSHHSGLWANVKTQWDSVASELFYKSLMSDEGLQVSIPHQRTCCTTL